MTREEWLNAAVKALNPMIERSTELTPATEILVSIGWPRRDKGGKVRGQCWARSAAHGKASHIFISPLQVEPVTILGILLHELIHAADDCESGHAGAFKKAHHALGFINKATTSEQGEELKERLTAVSERLGDFPHLVLEPLEKPKVQSTRMIKLVSSCGYVLRTSRKWIEQGLPTCGVCGDEFEEEEPK